MVILVTNLLIVEIFLLENEFGDQKFLIIKNPKIFGYLKETNLIVLQEKSKKTYRKRMWVHDIYAQTYVRKERKLQNYKKNGWMLCHICRQC